MFGFSTLSGAALSDPTKGGKKEAAQEPECSHVC